VRKCQCKELKRKLKAMKMVLLNEFEWLAKKDVEKLLKEEESRPAVLGKIHKVLVKHKSYPKESIADISYRIAKELGYK